MLLPTMINLPKQKSRELNSSTTKGGYYEKATMETRNRRYHSIPCYLLNGVHNISYLNMACRVGSQTIFNKNTEKVDNYKILCYLSNMNLTSEAIMGHRELPLKDLLKLLKISRYTVQDTCGNRVSKNLIDELPKQYLGFETFLNLPGQIINATTILLNNGYVVFDSLAVKVADNE